MNQPILWYFADPMCSWCWGFTSVIEQIKETYDDRMKIALVMGGLRPGTTQPITSSLREDLFHHWHEVQQLSGQVFSTKNALPDGFVYDTEPAARAVITVGTINPVLTFLYFKAVQSAFYTQNIDVTKTENLMNLAKELDIDSKSFLEIFNSDDARKKTQMHFTQTRGYGVRGFPTLIAQDAKHQEVLTNGYRPFKELRLSIDNWLQGNSETSGDLD